MNTKFKKNICRFCAETGAKVQLNSVLDDDGKFLEAFVAISGHKMNSCDDHNAWICKDCSEYFKEVSDLRQNVINENQTYLEQQEDENTSSFDETNKSSTLDGDTANSNVLNNDQGSLLDYTIVDLTEESEQESLEQTFLNTEESDYDSSFDEIDASIIHNVNTLSCFMANEPCSESDESDQDYLDLGVKRLKYFKSNNIINDYNLNRQSCQHERRTKRPSDIIVHSTPIKSTPQRLSMDHQPNGRKILTRRALFRDQSATRNAETFQSLIVNSWKRGSNEPDQPYSISDKKEEILLKFKNHFFVNSMQQMKMDGTHYFYWSCSAKYIDGCTSKIMSVKSGNLHTIDGIPSEHTHEAAKKHSKGLPEIITYGRQGRSSLLQWLHSQQKQKRSK